VPKVWRGELNEMEAGKEKKDYGVREGIDRAGGKNILSKKGSQEGSMCCPPNDGRREQKKSITSYRPKRLRGKKRLGRRVQKSNFRGKKRVGLR